MYWSSPLVAQAVTLGLVDPRRLSRLARRVCRNAGDLASCDVVWANELVAHGYLTRYQAQTLLWQVGPTDAPRPSRIASISTPLKIGPYLVQEHIASSDMGMTFRCRRSGQRGESAVKLLESQWTTEEGTRARIVAESAAWSELQLDGVMPLELVEQGQRLGLASPWLRAYPLESWVRAGRRLSPNGAIGFICRLIATLAAADARGLVHGDLKPSNVLVGVRGKVLLLDCGVRRGMAGAQVRIARNLSPDCYRYVAPEIASGECDPDVASDIYSLGCLLYHLICGQPPYSGANAERMGLAHRSGRPLAPHMLGIEMGRETQRLLGDCMQPDRSRRIGSYSELLSRVPPSVWKGGQAGSEIRRVGRRGGNSSRLLVRDPSGHRLGRAAKWIAVSVAILVAATAIGLSSWVPPLLRIGTARKSQPIAADNRRGPNPDRVMPGSVVSDLLNASEDLRRAYQNASPHDTITLQSPGPFLLDAIEIGKPITIRGALHVRPLFVGGPSASLRVIASGVRLENMHFMRLTGIERNESDGPTAGIVEAIGSDLAMSHCSFQDIDLGQAASVSWRPAGWNLAEPPHLVLECVLFRDV